MLLYALGWLNVFLYVAGSLLGFMAMGAGMNMQMFSQAAERMQQAATFLFSPFALAMALSHAVYMVDGYCNLPAEQNFAFFVPHFFMATATCLFHLSVIRESKRPHDGRT